MRKHLAWTLVVGLLGSPLYSEKKKESDIKKAGKSVNEALDSFADSVHKVAGKANKEGNSFFQEIDDAVHRAWRKLTSPSKK